MAQRAGGLYVIKRITFFVTVIQIKSNDHYLRIIWNLTTVSSIIENLIF